MPDAAQATVLKCYWIPVNQKGNPLVDQNGEPVVFYGTPGNTKDSVKTTRPTDHKRFGFIDPDGVRWHGDPREKHGCMIFSSLDNFYGPATGVILILRKNNPDQIPLPKKKPT